jgi:hypothetical protein
MNVKLKDWGIRSLAVIIGMTLVFIFLSVKSSTILNPLIGITVGLLLLGVYFALSKSMPRRRRKILEFTDSVSVPEKTCIDIIFAPPVAMMNPRLTLTSRNYNLEVEEVWQAGNGTLQGQSKPLYRWHRGIYYPGLVDDRHPLIARIRNPGARSAITPPAVVSARLVGYREKA